MTIVVRSDARSGQAGRLSAFYAASFLVVGVQLPFWPVWLSSRGLDAREIALVFAVAIWGNVAAAPVLGALADRLGRRRMMMIVLAALAFVAYAELFRVGGLGPILALNLVAAVAQSALMPIGDSITLAAVREEGFDYGRIRVWGSVSFIGAALLSGSLLTIGSRDADRVLMLVLAASAVLVIACGTIPAAGSAAVRPRWVEMLRLAADRRFWLFVASAAALQASHQIYYGFGTLYWRTLGFSDSIIGGLWAEAVLAEIVLFWCGAPLVGRLGPLGLMASGGLAGIVRWSLMGIVPGLAAAALLQLLHALTFGAVHLGAMHFLSRHAPPGLAASAQALYAALSSGLGSGLVMLAAGALYAAYGGHAYPVMALLSAAGLYGVFKLRRTFG